MARTALCFLVAFTAVGTLAAPAAGFPPGDARVMAAAARASMNAGNGTAMSTPTVVTSVRSRASFAWHRLSTGHSGAGACAACTNHRAALGMSSAKAAQKFIARGMLSR